MSRVASRWRQRGRFGVWGGGLATGLLVPINMCLLQMMKQAEDLKMQVRRNAEESLDPVQQSKRAFVDMLYHETLLMEASTWTQFQQQAFNLVMSLKQQRQYQQQQQQLYQTAGTYLQMQPASYPSADRPQQFAPPERQSTLVPPASITSVWQTLTPTHGQPQQYNFAATSTPIAGGSHDISGVEDMHSFSSLLRAAGSSSTAME